MNLICQGYLHFASGLSPTLVLHMTYAASFILFLTNMKHGISIAANEFFSLTRTYVHTKQCSTLH